MASLFEHKHLQFRSVVSVALLRNDKSNDVVAIEVGLANRVCCINHFGRFYIWFIHKIHENLVAPSLLQRACMFMFK